MSKKEKRESSNSDSGNDAASDKEDEEVTKPSDDTVLNKYTAAGEIANTVLKVNHIFEE
jgi:hypothetical protein